MPRGNDGVYNLPSNNWTNAFPGEVIQSAPKNSTEDDIAQALTDSIDRNGTTKILADIPMDTFKFTNVGNAVDPKNLATAGQVATNALSYCGTATGDGNAIVVTNNFIDNLSPGMVVTFTPNSDNSSGSVTLKINGLDAKDVKYADGNPLVISAIKQNVTQQLIYTGTNFVLSNPITEISVRGQVKEVIAICFAYQSSQSNSNIAWADQNKVLWNSLSPLTAGSSTRAIEIKHPSYVSSMVLEAGYDYDIILVAPALLPAVVTQNFDSSKDSNNYCNGGVAKFINMNLDSCANQTGFNGMTFYGGLTHFLETPSSQLLRMFGGIGFTSSVSYYTGILGAEISNVSRHLPNPIQYENVASVRNGVGVLGYINNYDNPNFIKITDTRPEFGGNPYVTYEDSILDPYGNFSIPVVGRNYGMFGTQFNDSVNLSVAQQQTIDDTIYPAPSNSLLYVTKKIR